MIKPNWIAVTWETWKLVNEQKRIKPTHPAQRDEKYASFSEKKKDIELHQTKKLMNFEGVPWCPCGANRRQIWACARPPMPNWQSPTTASTVLFSPPHPFSKIHSSIQPLFSLVGEKTPWQVQENKVRSRGLVVGGVVSEHTAWFWLLAEWKVGWIGLW